MESFETRLNRTIRLVPLAQIDSRLDSPSDFSFVGSATEHMAPLDKQVNKVAPVNVNLRRHEPAVAEDILSEANDDIELEPEAELEPDTGLDLEPDDQITADDLPDQGAAATPSGSNYTIDMAKGQLDGIIDKWMDLAGNYPEGEKRHNFLEIGERLREISGVIHRDYIQKGEGI